MGDGQSHPRSGTQPRGIGKLLCGVDRAAGFGFYLLDQKMFYYAAGTAICGVGIGLLVDGSLRLGRIQFDFLGWIAIVLVGVGALMANIAHARLKTQALKQSSPPNEDKVGPP